MANRYQAAGRVEELRGRAKRCCCKYCGGKLELRRIIFSDDEDARIELFCSQCDRIEYGIEPEIYNNAIQFVDRLKFNIYADLDDNEKTRRMNIAKVCEIMAWGDKNLGILDGNGFNVPVKNCTEVSDKSMVLTKAMLAADEAGRHE